MEESGNADDVTRTLQTSSHEMDVEKDPEPESSVSDAKCADSGTSSENTPSQLTSTSSQDATQSQDVMMEQGVEISETPSGGESSERSSSILGERNLEVAREHNMQTVEEDGQLSLMSDQDGTIIPVGGTIIQETTQASGKFTGKEAENFLKRSGLPAKIWEASDGNKKELHLHFTKTTASIVNPGGVSVGGNVIVNPPKEETPPKQKSKFQILRDKTSEQIKEWTQGMIETNAVKAIADKVKQGHPIVVVTGSPGEGKTTTAYLALKRLQDMGREVFEARRPEDYFTAKEARGCPVILIGDIWGSSCFSRDKLSTWEGVLEDTLDLHVHKFSSEKDQNKSERKGLQQPVIILVTRQGVVSSASHHLGKYKSIILGKDNQINLSEEDTLSTDEKMRIWYHHAKLHHVEVEEREARKVCMMSLPHGFPHICHLFASMYEKYSKIGMTSFFRKPVDFLKQSLESLLEEPIAGPLLRAMLKNEGVLSLDSIEDDEKVYQYQTVVNNLKDTYLKQSGDEVSFHHPSIYDSAAYVVCSKSPRFVIQNCSMSFLNHMVCFDDLESGGQDQQISVHVENRYIQFFLGRLKREFDEQNLSSLLSHGCFHDEGFASKFMDTILPGKDSQTDVDLRNVLQLKDKTTGHSFLFHAADSGSNKVLKYILERLHLTEEEQSDALLGIVENGSVESLKSLLSAFSSLKLENPVKDSLTPLLMAAKKPATGVLRLLIQAGADVKASSDSGNTVLHLMCMNATDDCGDIVTLLAQRGIDVNAENEDSLFPLHAACHQGNLYAVSALLQNGADITKMDGRGFLPVHTASVFQHNSVLMHLLENGADIDAESIHGETPLHVACMLGIKSQINTLIKRGADLNSGKYASPIHSACGNGNETAVAILLEKGVDIEWKGKCGLFPPLHMACWSGNDRLVKQLLDRGARIDSLSVGNATPLHLACISRHEAIVKLLLEKEASVNVADKQGNTPLHMVCHMNLCKVQTTLWDTQNQCKNALLGDTELESVQSQEHADMIQTDLMPFWESALSEDEAEEMLFRISTVMSAKLRGPNSDLRGRTNRNIINMLLDAGANCNSLNNMGHAPLHHACLSGEPDSMKLLISRGADLNGGGLVNPLQVSSTIGNNIAIKILCDSGADVNKANKANAFGPLYSAVTFGRNDTVTYLIERGANVNITGLGGLTPIHCAAIVGYGDVVQNLVSNGANVNKKCFDGAGPLHIASLARQAKAAEILLNNGAHVNDAMWLTNDTPLHLVCSQMEENHFGPLIEMLNALKKMTDVNVPLESPICEEMHDLNLLLNNNMNRVRDFDSLSDGAAVDMFTRVGFDMLDYFAENTEVPVTTDNTELLCHLLNRGADANKQNDVGNLPLHLSCKEGNVAFVESLLRNGSKIDIKNEDGLTPLHYAANGGHSSIVAMLLGVEMPPEEVGEDTYPDSIKDTTPDVSQEIEENMDSACSKKDLSERQNLTAVGTAINNTVEMLDEVTGTKDTDRHSNPCLDNQETLVKAKAGKRKVDVNATDNRGNTPLHLACLKGADESVVKMLLKSGADLSIKSKDGWTPLYHACCEGYEKIVTMLISHKAEFDESLAGGYRPLHGASLNGNETVVRLLLDCKAEVNSETDDGSTPMHLACEANSVETIELLLKRGADLIKASQSGDTPLHIACQNGHIDVVTCLLDKGASVHDEDTYGSTPLHDACVKGNCSVVTLLLNRDADVNKGDNTGCTPLHDACTHGNNDVVVTLLDKGADMKKEDHSGCTPLHSASSNGHKDIVITLLDRGAEVSKTDSSLRTPLHKACENGYRNVAVTLIGRGADVNQVDSAGNTPLHTACEKGHYHMGTPLLLSGANINKGDNFGNTPLHNAAQNGHIMTVGILLQLGADTEKVNHEGKTASQLAENGGHRAVIMVLKTSK